MNESRESKNAEQLEELLLLTEEIQEELEQKDQLNSGHSVSRIGKVQ